MEKSGQGAVLHQTLESSSAANALQSAMFFPTFAASWLASADRPSSSQVVLPASWRIALQELSKRRQHCSDRSHEAADDGI
jgi:hypothetical protein